MGRKLNKEKLKSRKRSTMSMKDSLQDIEPITWDGDESNMEFMFAIRNKKTGKFVYGTDKRYNPHHQLTSKNRMLTYDELMYAAFDLRHRQCSDDYEVVELEPIKVKRSFTRDEVEKIVNKYYR